MTKPTSPMLKALKQADIHGYLRERDGKAYSRGSDTEPVCTLATLRALIERGWLSPPFRGKYELSREGMRVVRSLYGEQ